MKTWKKATREKNITKEQENLYEQRKQEEFEKHIRKSTLHYSFDQEVQMDAAFWIWFGSDETALHLSVDKATKKVLSGWFDYEETTNAYTILLINMIKNFGIPDKIKTDKRSSFSINNAKSSKSKLNVTQFKRICEDLEINLVCSSDPLFKPNAERENGTFKRRLKAELRHEGINDTIRNERTIDNASSIKYLTNYYLPVDESTGEIISFKSGTKCTVVNTYDNKLLGIINEKIYILQLVEKQNDSIRASKNGFKPSDDNPWRKFKIR